MNMTYDYVILGNKFSCNSQLYQSDQSEKYVKFYVTQPLCTCSNSTMETPKPYVYYVLVQQYRHENDSFWCLYC